MRVATETQSNSVTRAIVSKNESEIPTVIQSKMQENSLNQLMKSQEIESEEYTFPKEKVRKAVDALNEFMTLQNHNSKFVMHDGLERYYVQVVDSKTEKLIREVPPKKLLDAFYTMQKFLGMIVDEKI